MSNKNNKDDLKGFEEFIEYEKARGHSIPGQGKLVDAKDGIEQINFLENEKDRVKKLADLFESKLPLMNTYLQTDRLIQDQIDVNTDLEMRLIKRFIPLHSSVNDHLAKVFDQHFSELEPKLK